MRLSSDGQKNQGLMNDGQQPPSPAGPSLILLTLLPLFSLCFTATEECLRPFQPRLRAAMGKNESDDGLEVSSSARGKTQNKHVQELNEHRGCFQCPGRCSRR